MFGRNKRKRLEVQVEAYKKDNDRLINQRKILTDDVAGLRDDLAERTRERDGLQRKLDAMQPTDEMIALAKRMARRAAEAQGIDPDLVGVGGVAVTPFGAIVIPPESGS